MRTLAPALLLVALLAGCATPMPAVRDFGGETQKLASAFTPVVRQTVENCRLLAQNRAVYTDSRELERFDPAQVVAQSTARCASLAESADGARAVADLLGGYAKTLVAIANDGVSKSLDGDLDGLARKAQSFADLDSGAASGVSAVARLLARQWLAREQREAVAELLSHEQAVGAMADALNRFTARVYGGYLKDLDDTQGLVMDVLKAQDRKAVAPRLQMMEWHRQAELARRQQRAVPAFDKAVRSLKATLAGLRQNQSSWSETQRGVAIAGFAEDVRQLRELLDAAP